MNVILHVYVWTLVMYFSIYMVDKYIWPGDDNYISVVYQLQPPEGFEFIKRPHSFDFYTSGFAFKFDASKYKDPSKVFVPNGAIVYDPGKPDSRGEGFFFNCEYMEKYREDFWKSPGRKYKLINGDSNFLYIAFNIDTGYGYGFDFRN